MKSIASSWFYSAFILLISIFSIQISIGQCLMRPINIEDQIANSELIIEGEVVDS